MPAPRFERYFGVDYSGAQTADQSLPGLRIYEGTPGSEPVEVLPPPSPRKYFTRQEVAEWLVAQLRDGPPTLVGIDHGFSFPLRYFEVHRIEPNWDTFLDDFKKHWPTDLPNVYVQFIRDGFVGQGDLRTGSPRWRRATEERCRGKSVFHFDVQGSVAKSTHAGLPWLRYIRQHVDAHFWPFDGWSPAAGRSVIAEVYPSLWKKLYPVDNRTPDQQDAYSIVRWFQEHDALGDLAWYFNPDLTGTPRMVAALEGWILGVL